MRVIYVLSTVALLCGVWRGVEATKHFEPVYSWSEIDYLFPSDEIKASMIADRRFVAGDAVPTDMAVDAHTGRTFLVTSMTTFGIPYSLSTVSESKNAKGEHLLQPYPNHEMHTTGCDGISSAESITIDECGRLWVMDMGSVTKLRGSKAFSYDCSPKLLVFDLKTDQVIKTFTFSVWSFQAPDSFIGSLAIEILSTDNECRDTFAYIADAGRYEMVVFDFANNETWNIKHNQMYPDPKFGHFHYKGIHFDGMYGIHGMALRPKHEGDDRTLYFNSMASGKDSYVATSVLRNKTNFDDAPKSPDFIYHLYNQFHTMTVPRPGGPACMGPIFDNVMFYGSYLESAVYCWNLKTEYSTEHIVEVDKDDVAFDMLSTIKAVKHKDGVPHLYVMSNSYENFIHGDHPGSSEVQFRILKAPINKLVEGTACAST